MDLKHKISSQKLDIKAVGEDGTIEGYASTFGNMDSYRDVCVKGCFKRTLDNKGARGIKMLWQHRADSPIGVWEEMYEDDHGLKCKGKINLEVEKGKECYSLLKQGAIDGISIGFMVEKEDYDREENIRYIKEINLYEASLVTFPANMQATVSDVKSFFEDLDETKEHALYTIMTSLRVLFDEKSGLEDGEVTPDQQDDSDNESKKDDELDNETVDSQDADDHSEEKSDDSIETTLHSIDVMIQKTKERI